MDTSRADGKPTRAKTPTQRPKPPQANKSPQKTKQAQSDPKPRSKGLAREEIEEAALKSANSDKDLAPRHRAKTSSAPGNLEIAFTEASDGLRKRLEVKTVDGKTYRGLAKTSSEEGLMQISTEGGKKVSLEMADIISMRAFISLHDLSKNKLLAINDDPEIRDLIRNSIDIGEELERQIPQVDLILLGEYHYFSYTEVLISNPHIIEKLKENNFVIALERDPDKKISNEETLGEACLRWQAYIEEHQEAPRDKEFNKFIRSLTKSYKELFIEASKQGLPIKLIDRQLDVREHHQSTGEFGEVTRDKLMFDETKGLLEQGYKVLFLGGGSHTAEGQLPNHQAPQYKYEKGKGKAMAWTREEARLGERLVKHMSDKYGGEARSKVFSMFFHPSYGLDKTGLKKRFNRQYREHNFSSADIKKFTPEGLKVPNFKAPIAWGFNLKNRKVLERALTEGLTSLSENGYDLYDRALEANYDFVCFINGLHSRTQISLASYSINDEEINLLDLPEDAEELDLAKNSITRYLSPLGQRHIQSLNLAENNVESSGDLSFDGMDNLRKVDLSKNPIAQKPEEIEALKAKYPTLEIVI